MAPTAERKPLARMTTPTDTIDRRAGSDGINGHTSNVTKGCNERHAVAKVGMKCDLKNLYQKEDDKGRTSWTDKYPEDLDEAAENEVTAGYAILVRNKKSFDSRKKLDIDSIVVQSPLLKQVLTKVLKDYPGMF